MHRLSEIATLLLLHLITRKKESNSFYRALCSDLVIYLEFHFFVARSLGHLLSFSTGLVSHGHQEFLIAAIRVASSTIRIKRVVHQALC
jgi:hypothetical protein